MKKLKRFNLSSKIGLSFGFLLVLLLAAAFAGINGLHHADNGFVQYRELARDSNLSGRLQANMLKVRMAVKNYLISHEDSALEQYDERMALMQSFLNQSKQEISNPERSRLIMETATLLERYESAFKEVKELIQKEDDLYYQILAQEGPKMLEGVSALQQLTYDRGAHDIAFDVANLQEDLLVARLYLVRFIEKQYDEDFEVAKKSLAIEMPRKLRALRQLPLLSNERALLAQVETARGKYLSATQEMHTTILQRQHLVLDTLDVIGPQVAVNVEKVKLSVIADQDELGPQLQSHNEQGFIFVITISVVATIIGIFFAFAITRMITRPILNAVDYAGTLAEGDLTRSITVDRRDEVGELQSALEYTSQQFKSMITEINDVSFNMSSSAQELAALTEQSRAGTNQQQEETDQVAAAVNQMAYSAQHVADNASNAASSAQSANQQVNDGRSKMVAATDGMQRLSFSLEKTASEVTHLQQKTKDINAILDVIREIAEQTNLLALNAAIEAARAGEQGRGFAVVADEVRSLAQRTQQSTEMIHDLINNLQTRANLTVQVVDQGSVDAKACISLVEQADQALHEISNTVAHMNDVNAQIASSAEQQSLVADEISQNLTNVRVVAEQSSAAADETANSSVELSEVACNMQIMVQRFKLS